MQNNLLKCLRLQVNKLNNKNFIGVRRISDLTKPDPLVDNIGRRHTYLRISLTERCNLRCQYCMPAGGAPLSPKPELLTTEEMLRITQALVKLGITKVRLTGGEPTLRKDLPEIIQSISSLPGVRSVSLTTNGLTLTRRLPSYQRAGLNAINVSLDSLQKEKYEQMARRPGLARVLAGIDLALQLGYKPLKINTVLMRGFNDDEVCDFVAYTRDREIEVRFIEFMPFSGNSWDEDRLVPHKELLNIIRQKYPDLQRAPPRLNDTAQVFAVPGHLGSVGLISSMTRPFCGSCNRLRLTATGGLKVCLFGAPEVNLREFARAHASDDELARVVKMALSKKKPQHAVTLPDWRRHDRARRRADCSDGAHWRVAGWKNSLQMSRRARRSIPLSLEYSPQQNPSHIYFMDQQTSAMQTRLYSNLTHVDSSGRARMVDVGEKKVTQRRATAQCYLLLQSPTLCLLRNNALRKGDALCVAELAGVMAAKKTSELIPLCHQIPLTSVNVSIQLPEDTDNSSQDLVRISIECTAACLGRTGVEMEALTGANVAALALYDMCKAVDKQMRVTDLRVTHKSGGRSGDVYK